MAEQPDAVATIAMDAPVIPDHRPHKAPSVLSYSPTIVLDDCDPDYPYPVQEDRELDMRPKPNRTQSFPEREDQDLDVRPKPIRTQSHGDRELVNGSLASSDRQTPLRIEGEQSPTPHQELEEADGRELRSQPSLKSMRRNYTVNELPLLQATNPNDGSEQFHPVEENEAGAFDLVAPYEGDEAPLHSLERQADTMFSSEHMRAILTNPRYLARFRQFLLSERPRSLPRLTYYLNACKALRAIEYANALVRLSVDVPPVGIEPAKEPVGATTNAALEVRVREALDALTAEELPAFITSTCIGITSKVVEERVRGTLPDKFQGTSDALAEVFCLTDPSRPDNPIIFASGEFHRTTQYGMDYVLGRNCRFLQGPKTNKNSVRRIREAIQAGRHHSELFLNYRRDGSPFMNLLQCAPLCDSHGKIRYFIGAQIDVSGLAMEGAQMESLQSLIAQEESPENPDQPPAPAKTEFQEMNELFSPRELQNVHQHGGSLFHPIGDQLHATSSRLFLPGPEEGEVRVASPPAGSTRSNPHTDRSLTGVYKHYLLVRPYPSLRVLFTSPSLQIPGMLQSSFLSRIGDSGEKRDSILHAMMAGRSVTARIKWVTRFSDQGRHRWIHCTPLVANNGEVGVWMVVIIDDADEHLVQWQGNWPTH